MSAKSSESSLPREDLAKILSAVGNSLIDFLVLFTQEEKKWDKSLLGSATEETLLGSGTLVAFDSTQAILTADHVLQKVEQPSGSAHLLFPTRFDRSQPLAAKSSIQIPMEYLEKRKIGRGVQQESGPDLGLLVLPGPIASRFVPSTKNYYNLSMRRRQIMSSSRAIDTGLWVLAGAPAEWTEQVPGSDSRFAKLKKQGSLLGFGDVTREYTRDDFDYLEFLVEYNARYKGPHRFGGCSGGGLWHIILDREETGEIVIKEKILSGRSLLRTRTQGRQAASEVPRDK